MRYLVTGGTGFIGSALVEHLLDSGHEVRVLTRRPSRYAGVGGLQYIGWDQVGTENYDGVVNLAGESLFKRWTARNRRRIRESRIDLTRHLLDKLRDSPPEVLVNASAVGYYGNAGDAPLTEASPSGDGFGAKLCRDWEKQAEAFSELGVRVCRLRFGVVLGRQGGMLKMLTPLFRLGLGGPTGNGRQWMSWIYLPDLVQIIMRALVDPRFAGAFNAVAPEPVTNRDFARKLGARLHRPVWLPAPAFALRLIFAGAADDVLLASQRALPDRLQKMGYEFDAPNLDKSLEYSFPGY